MQFVWVVHGTLEIEVSQDWSVVVPHEVVHLLERVILQIPFVHLNHIVLAVRLQKVRLIRKVDKLGLSPVFVYPPLALLSARHVDFKHARVLSKLEVGQLLLDIVHISNEVQKRRAHFVYESLYLGSLDYSG